MVVIYTGVEEIDKELQKVIKDSIIAHYSEYLVENNTFEGQTVIISTKAIGDNLEDLHEFLYTLKKMDVRIILLLKNQRQEEIKIALGLGIYDIIYGNFYPSQIKEILKKPKTFKDISEQYRKAFNVKVKNRQRVKEKRLNSFFSRK